MREGRLRQGEGCDKNDGGDDSSFPAAVALICTLAAKLFSRQHGATGNNDDYKITYPGSIPTTRYSLLLSFLIMTIPSKCVFQTYNAKRGNYIQISTELLLKMASRRPDSRQ